MVWPQLPLMDRQSLLLTGQRFPVIAALAVVMRQRLLIEQQAAGEYKNRLACCNF